MSRIVEEQLHKHFDPIAPDFLSEIEAAQIERIDSEDLLFSELNRVHKEKVSYSYLIRYASVAAVVFLCVISMFVYRNSYSTVETVTIQAGATITMSLNRANKVIRVEMSEETDLDKSDLEGKSFEESLDRVLDSVSSSNKQKSKEVSISCEGSEADTSAKKIIDKVAKNYEDNCDIAISGSSQNAKNVDTLDYADSDLTGKTQASSTEEAEAETDSANSHPVLTDELTVQKDMESTEVEESDKADQSESEDSDAIDMKDTDSTEMKDSDISEIQNSDASEMQSSDISEMQSSDTSEMQDSDVSETEAGDTEKTAGTDIEETTAADDAESKAADNTQASAGHESVEKEDHTQLMP